MTLDELGLFLFIREMVLDYSLFLSGILFTLAALIISETGKIFIGSLIYIIGDVVYLVYALFLDNWFGIVSLTFALLFGARTLYKMHYGIFKKDLKDSNYTSFKKDMSMYYKDF